VEQGAHQVDYGTDMIILGEMGWAPRKPGVKGLISSRALVDFVTLQSLRGIPSVEIRERTEAMGLRIEGSGRTARVTGVELRNRETGERTEVAADLVVDTCGRGSKTLEWLEAVGLPRPDETVVEREDLAPVSADRRRGGPLGVALLRTPADLPFELLSLLRMRIHT
jgi:hypothetical protein